MRKILLALGLSILLSGCGTPGRQASTSSPDVATYEGVLQGMYCDRVQVRLQLDARDFHYRWREESLEDTDCTRAADKRGRWTIEQAEHDRQAILYQLDPGDESGPRNFLRLDARRIKVVDERGEEFWRPYNLILERADEPAADDPF